MNRSEFLVLPPERSLSSLLISEKTPPVVNLVISVYLLLYYF